MTQQNFKAPDGWALFYYNQGFQAGLSGKQYAPPSYDAQHFRYTQAGYMDGVEKAKLNKLRELVLGNDSI